VLQNFRAGLHESVVALQKPRVACKNPS